MRTPPAANIADEASERLAKKRPAEKLNYTHVRHQGPVGTVEGVWAPRGTLSSRKRCVVWNRYALTVCSVSKNLTGRTRTRSIANINGCVGKEQWKGPARPSLRSSSSSRA